MGKGGERERKEQKMRKQKVNPCSTSFSFTGNIYKLPLSISFTPVNMIPNYFVPAIKAMQGLNTPGKL